MSVILETALGKLRGNRAGFHWSTGQSPPSSQTFAISPIFEAKTLKRHFVSTNEIVLNNITVLIKMGNHFKQVVLNCSLLFGLHDIHFFYSFF